MARRGLAPCAYRGCPTLTLETYCPVHKPEPWQGRRNYEGYQGNWPKIRAQVLSEEPHCRECGQAAVTVDHIIPKARGGTDARSNLRSLCNACRRIKDAADAAEGRRLAHRAREGRGV